MTVVGGLAWLLVDGCYADHQPQIDAAPAASSDAPEDAETPDHECLDRVPSFGPFTTVVEVAAGRYGGHSVAILGGDVEWSHGERLVAVVPSSPSSLGWGGAVAVVSDAIEPGCTVLRTRSAIGARPLTNGNGYLAAGIGVSASGETVAIGITAEAEAWMEPSVTRLTILSAVDGWTPRVTDLRILAPSGLFDALVTVSDRVAVITSSIPNAISTVATDGSRTSQVLGADWLSSEVEPRRLILLDGDRYLLGFTSDAERSIVLGPFDDGHGLEMHSITDRLVLGPLLERANGSSVAATSDGSLVVFSARHADADVGGLADPWVTAAVSQNGSSIAINPAPGLADQALTSRLCLSRAHCVATTPSGARIAWLSSTAPGHDIANIADVNSDGSYQTIWSGVPDIRSAPGCAIDRVHSISLSASGRVALVAVGPCEDGTSSVHVLILDL